MLVNNRDPVSEKTAEAYDLDLYRVTAEVVCTWETPAELDTFPFPRTDLEIIVALQNKKSLDD